MLGRMEKALVDQIMVEAGTAELCLIAVLVRRVSRYYRESIYHDIPAYSALVINTNRDVQAHVSTEWNKP